MAPRTSAGRASSRCSRRKRSYARGRRGGGDSKELSNSHPVGNGCADPSPSSSLGIRTPSILATCNGPAGWRPNEATNAGPFGTACATASSPSTGVTRPSRDIETANTCRHQQKDGADHSPWSFHNVAAASHRGKPSSLRNQASYHREKCVQSANLPAMSQSRPEWKRPPNRAVLDGGMRRHVGDFSAAW